MKLFERRIVTQDWYETETTKTGWDSHGWVFEDGMVIGNDWIVVEIHSDKHGNPFYGVAEREVEVWNICD